MTATPGRYRLSIIGARWLHSFLSESYNSTLLVFSVDACQPPEVQGKQWNIAPLAATDNADTKSDLA